VAAGFGVLAVLYIYAPEDGSFARSGLPSGWLIASLVLLISAGLLPVEVLPNQKVNLTGAIGFALILLSSAWSAAILMAGAAGVTNLVLRRHWQNTLFNIGQLAISVGLAGVVYRHCGGSPEQIATSAQGAGCLVLAGGVIYVTNVLIVSTVASLAGGHRPWRGWFTDLRAPALSNVALLFTGVLGAIVARHGPWALPLLVLPLFLVHRLSRANARAREAVRQAENALAAQRRLVADASHQLRTPVTAVRGSAEVLLRGVNPEAQSVLVNGIHDQAVHLTRMVNDLLVMAQLDEGEKSIVEIVELDTLVKEVCQHVRSWARDVLIEVEREETLRVRGNADQLRQVIMNLLDNAAKFTPRGGRVSVALHGESQRAIVEVRDTGMGILQDDLPHIFSRFYRSRRQPPGAVGSGLGLSVAQAVTQAHGGNIRVKTEVDRGTTFIVDLPAISSSST